MSFEATTTKTLRSTEIFKYHRTRAIPEHREVVFTTRRYTNPRLPYLTLLCMV